MKPPIEKILRRLAEAYEHRVLKKKALPFGWAARLSRFEHEATEREWQQLMYYQEMIAKVGSVPGDVAEFGVAGGVSYLAFARCLRVMERGFDRKERRRLIGFDSFEGLPALSNGDRSPVASAQQMKEGGFQTPQLHDALFQFVENEPHCTLVKGWFDVTVPQFLTENPQTSFALVHIDCDLYESTKVVLDSVWEHVTVGGIVMFDELFHQDYPGETIAFREFAKSHSVEFTLSRSVVKPDKKYIIKTA